MTAGEPDGAVVAGGNRPLLLRADAAWRVREGAVDVFAGAAVDGDVTRRRRHLARVEAGGAVFGATPDGLDQALGLVAVGLAGTQLEPLAPAEIAADDLAVLVDGWIEALSTELHPGAPPDATGVEPSTQAAIAAGAAVTAGAGVVWVRCTDAAAAFLGDDALPPVDVGTWLPVTRWTWLRPAADTSVETLPTAMWLAGAPVPAGLAGFHALVLRRVAVDARRAVAAEQERLRRRAEDEQHVVARAVEELASTFQGADAALDVEASTDPLIEACALVAAATGVTFPVAAARHAASQAADRIAAIARAARVRVRQVALTGPWWREDAGPLLGFGRDDGRPLALLPTGRRRYVVVDPASGTREPVDRHVAGAVAEAAFTFYRPFPDRAVGVSDLLAFGGRGFRREIASVAALGLAGGLLALLTPIATGTIVSTLIPSADRDGLYALAAALVVAALAAGAFELVRSLALLRASGRLGGALDAAVMDRLLSLPVPFFRGYSAGDLALRASAINVIQQTLTGIVLSTVVSSVFSLLSIGLMLYYDVHLTLVAVLAVVAVVVVGGLADRAQLGRQRQVLALQGRVAALVFQLINGIAALRVAGGELRAFAGWARLFGAQRRQAAAARRATAAVTVFSATWSVAATLAVFWALAFWVQSGATTVEFIAFNAAFGQFTAAVLALAGAVTSALGVLPLYERARPILRTLPEVGEAKADPGRMRGAIELTGVSFRYVDDGPLVLQDVSLRVPPGQFVAFVGPSGAGKSTIYRMLLGFETPLSGTVFYDDQDLAGLDLRAVRRQIGVVLQNGRLMAGSIFENIVGAAPLTLDDAWEAARAAGFADDIEAMPMGMQTFIMEGATTLSGGQRQRLMIARAIVHRPRILLFDEATSALDNETQAIVSRSLERLQATRVVIAHRLSTIVRADRIYVIVAGRVVEAGTYDELMARNAEFARLARRQIA